MADSVFLDEVVGFLHNIDDPTVSGADLLLSLDKDAALLALPDTDIALQLLDVTPINGLFEDDKDHHSTDSECASTETESVASSSSPACTTVVENIRSRDAIRRCSYRQKQKDQKNALYKQVEELSLQLATLQNRKEDAEAKRGLGLAPTAVWKALANRYLQARLAAEDQQRRLHEAVEKRSALIRDLGVLIRKRISEEQHDGESVQLPSKRARVESPDMTLYETFIKELDEVYSRTDSVFYETDLTETDSFYNPSRPAVKDSSYHELTGRSTTPFPFDRVRSLVSQIRCMENRPGCERIQVHGVSDDTTVIKFRIEARVGMAVGSFVQHAITRRYYETNRVVVVWRKFTEGEGVYAGMHSDETGWNVIEPSPNSNGAGTSMKSIIRYVPMTFSTAASADGKLKEFTDTVIAAGEEDCQACVHKLEEMLLDDALVYALIGRKELPFQSFRNSLRYCAMADALFMDDVMGFLRHADDPSLPGSDLVESLDNDDHFVPLQGALQMLDATAIDGFFIADDTSDDGKDSDCTSVETQSVASSLSSPRNVGEVLNVRSRDAIRRSSYRQKQKAHKDGLKKQVDQLSAQLTTLLKNKETNKARQGAGLTQTTVWKALANRNLQARRNAEEQQRRLREAIDKRSALIRDLGTFIRKRISEESLEDTGHAAKKPRAESPDTVLYEAYINELDEVYAKTEIIFKETPVQIDDENGDEIRLYYNPVQPTSKVSSYHELVGAFSTPFPFDRVVEYLAKVCCMENHPGYELIEGPWVPEHTTITKARIEAPGGNWLVQHCILRRYNEGGRMVIVWRKFIEGEGMFAGMHSDETGWCIVRPSRSCVKGSSSTVMESVLRFIPINFSTATRSVAVMKQFADMTVKSGEDICQIAMQKLEEMLLDDTLGVC